MYTIVYNRIRMDSVSSRLPEDVAARVEEYAEQRGISQSEAVRRLIVAGLGQDEIEGRLRDVEERVEELEQPFWKRWR